MEFVFRDWTVCFFADDSHSIEDISEEFLLHPRISLQTKRKRAACGKEISRRESEPSLYRLRSDSGLKQIHFPICQMGLPRSKELKELYGCAVHFLIRPECKHRRIFVGRKTKLPKMKIRKHSDLS